ncbi:dehydrogenase/reductase SDR family member 12 [Pteropus vampyrus]|uniref:Dehydrogenase/reductase SDR family member 12 n=1 Tax=Pteropus vampyrus TaxID=132908 RepID=A0A6P6CYY1_PTEVA|nr:dehydrogenase/reductase SDR family member 12 [Pteropus vampyrus]
MVQWEEEQDSGTSRCSSGEIYFKRSREAEKDLKEINGPFFGVAELVANFSLGDRLTSRTGYESACEDFVPDDLEVQVAGRAFLVTGGKSGIGKATAIEIAKRGGTVHLVCRDKDRVQGAKGEIIRESGNQVSCSSSLLLRVPGLGSALGDLDSCLCSLGWPWPVYAGRRPAESWSTAFQCLGLTPDNWGCEV